jgi:hypothetical protein
VGPAIYIWLIYALWLALVICLTVSAEGIKRDTHGHLLQSFSPMFALNVVFLLPHLPIFHFLRRQKIGSRLNFEAWVALAADYNTCAPLLRRYTLLSRLVVSSDHREIDECRDWSYYWPDALATTSWTKWAS